MTTRSGTETTFGSVTEVARVDDVVSVVVLTATEITVAGTSGVVIVEGLGVKRAMTELVVRLAIVLTLVWMARAKLLIVLEKAEAKPEPTDEARCCVLSAILEMAELRREVGFCVIPSARVRE